MTNIIWMVRRLKAMSVPEIIWRLSQKKIQRKEEILFRCQKKEVTVELFDSDLDNLRLDAHKMYLNIDNKEYSLGTAIPLLGPYDYEQYKYKWNAGFQTQNIWPEVFSYVLEYKQRDDIGDARTNWELNRHYQFAILAKDYAASGNRKYLQEFQQLFDDWNQKNPFLWGISWTSVMEVAIRCSNWCYAFCFLSEAKNVPDELMKKLQTGILNMTEYIVNHYSRYSSANNHLIVEAYAIGQSGILCNNPEWISLAVDIMTRELPLQNYSDGVNKELSLHYQSFYMEAMGLLMRLLKKNKKSIPDGWYIWLDKMCQYLADCIGNYGEVVEFGDNDEGKILDLCGEINHYQYVLEMFSILLETQYCDINGCVCENIKWLFSKEEIIESSKKNKYFPLESVCYKEGGNTILRSRDKRITIGIDHAALGFSSIAAHGHADALSFQIFVEGTAVFVDPGTYIYHCNIEKRNAYRRTANHNTVCVNKRDQSEMLGAFLWGRKAECKLIKYEKNEQGVILKASHSGYAPAIHTRTYIFDEKETLFIYDEMPFEGEKEIIFVIRPKGEVIVHEDNACILLFGRKYYIEFESDDKYSINVIKGMGSFKYGFEEKLSKIVLTTHGANVRTKITIGEI